MTETGPTDRDLPRLDAIEWLWHPHGEGVTARLHGVWKNPNAELKGRTVLIDGVQRVVRGIDTYAHAPPFGRGECVLVVLEPKP